ncbi:PREDICTED: retinol dehydrogenase 14-like isoform X2 [Poecilia mexicana]|uniref:Si:dkey-174n20.1 n=2 Tax=Poecilia TaxID=8080 RepID=A0A087Y8F1_POEFO|nr:PREDICTED: retinol dehydrogenase 14-like isoform X2 [Poecilia formosa]XP_014868544.1 PREDICTED: retinol dehydrogenase 14-like isoform X2 [Poecilia mexicana]
MYLLYTVVASLSVFLVLKWMKRRRYFTELKRLDGKTVLITGGNSGTGKETAVALATRGARVIIACRDPEKAEEAVREIKLQSRSFNVFHMELDLANLRSVRDFCKKFLQKEKSLHILVNNAGMPGILDWTDDGFSMCFGVNHLGHFLLTNLLLPRLKECAPSRVITLTCSSYKYQKLDFQDLNYNLLPFFTYCRSKLANIYFSQELARITEGKGVTSYAVHPGFVQSGWTCHFSFLFRMFMQVIMWMFSVPCEIGAQTVIYCAVSDEAAKHSGGYFVDCQPATLRPFARDAGVAKKLWEASERLVKLA